MRRYTDRQVLRLGALTLVVMAVVLAAAFNLSKFPGFGGTSYSAELADASGLRVGNQVQVAGIRVGRVQDVELARDRVLVRFEVDHGVELGPETAAAVEVQSLLGDKFLELTPAGEGDLDPGDTIPLERTTAAYDIVGVFGDLTRTTERIDTDRLARALDVVADTADRAAPEIDASLDGITRLSRSVASRDEEIQQLLLSSREVGELLAARSQDVVDLMADADLVFQEVERRKRAVHRLLVNARDLARELRGVARDNQDEIGPALAEVDDLLGLLVDKEAELKATLDALGPYVSILSNIIGTGPWFDAYAANLLAIPTGEFVPAPLEE